MPPACKKCFKYEQGFSFLEICICLIILGLITSGFTFIYSKTVEQGKMQKIVTLMQEHMVAALFAKDHIKFSFDGGKSENYKDFLKYDIIQKESQEKLEPASERIPGGGNILIRKSKDTLWLCLEKTSFSEKSLKILAKKFERPCFVKKNDEGFVLGIHIEN